MMGRHRQDTGPAPQVDHLDRVADGEPVERGVEDVDEAHDLEVLVPRGGLDAAVPVGESERDEEWRVLGDRAVRLTVV